MIFIAKRQVAIWNHTHFSIKFFWLASTGHISASTEAILKNFMCFPNYSKRSFQWNWSHFSIFIQIEMTEETRWHVKKAKCQISSKRPFSVKNHKEAIKKNFPNGFFSLMAQSTQEGVYFWDPVTKFFEIFFKVVPGSKMAWSHIKETTRIFARFRGFSGWLFREYSRLPRSFITFPSGPSPILFHFTSEKYIHRCRNRRIRRHRRY